MVLMGMFRGKDKDDGLGDSFTVLFGFFGMQHVRGRLGNNQPGEQRSCYHSALFIHGIFYTAYGNSFKG